MNDDIADIENALRRLTPRAPSAFCTARIATVLDAPARPLTFRRVFAWGGPLAAAAAVAAFALILSRNPAQQPVALPQLATQPQATTLPQPEDTFALAQDESASIAPTERRVLRSVEPLEIRRTQDGNFFQPYRVRYLNTVRASAPRRAGASPATFVESVPTEEVHFVRLDFM